MACGSVNPASTMRQSLPPKAVLALRLPDMPILIYLHSMGALLNFETPRLLAKRNPLHCSVSSCRGIMRRISRKFIRRAPA